ncbi:SacI homology domain-containing protein [Halteromyces radiatus]|uniref:SacI homology domain-containing protein n=1 Tax=Halteromyces radiatus TaxID=101107 RepID=UPI0022209159|nr:SacI homology domain-containing protein [Halteromyces radiatus]KAI8086043.1 SacI homology domain-containing protein [Halteromyces radiatus]
MIVVTGRTLVGTLLGNAILRGTTFQILPMSNPSWGKSYSDNLLFEQEQKLIHLLESHLRLNSFYFSYTYDLTNSLQRQSKQKIDDRFYWNKHLSTKFIMASYLDDSNKGIKAYTLPVIQGYISITSMIIDSKQLTFALISRRSHERAGTRYFSRGIDEDGHVSNYVETEQIVIYDTATDHSSSLINKTSLPLSTLNNKQIHLSFIQTRGSIPIFWGQIPNTRYVPQLWYAAHSSSKNIPAAKKHFDDQLRIYGPNVLINLTNKTGYEQPLGDIYARTIQDLNNPNIRYIHYDFHQECKNLQWHRVQALIDRLIPDLEKAGYYRANTEDEPLSQVGVIRTNCIDCLDRTNVVQSMLAKWMIQSWQRDIGVDLSSYPDFLSMFNSAWADNANNLSLSYSGTGALKTDFTRQGKRTMIGALNDLNNSIVRYIKNNYFDGSRQDAIDLFLGKYARDDTPQRRIQYDNGFISQYASWKVQAVPPAMISSSFLFFWLLFFSDSTPIESSTLYILLLSFCFAVLVSTWLFIQQHGVEFIDWPKLNPLPLDIDNNIELPSFLSSNWFFHSSENLDQVEQGKKVT